MIKKTIRNNKGFTILELIVVIAIMGFLIALVAPRLAGVSDSSKKPICISNQQRIYGAVSRMLQENDRFPDKLISLIPVKANAEKGSLLTKSNGSRNNWISDVDGKENTYFSHEFEKNNLYVHQLDIREMQELSALGIKNVIDYETGKEKLLNTGGVNKETDAPSVLMIGAGASDIGKIVNNSVKKGTKFSDPDLMYRIVLGVNEQSELVTEDIVRSISGCPTAKQHKNVDYKNYSIVLPRLESTVKRLDSTTPKKIMAKGYAKGINPDITSSTPIVDEMEFIIDKIQRNSDFIILCPEGERSNDSEVSIWNIEDVK